jgi:hypothetical protein
VSASEEYLVNHERYVCNSNITSIKQYYITILRLVWYPGQNKRIAPLSVLNGCRKRRLKRDIHTTCMYVCNITIWEIISTATEFFIGHMIKLLFL